MGAFGKTPLLKSCAALRNAASPEVANPKGLAEKSGGFIPEIILPRSFGLGLAIPEGLNIVAAGLAKKALEAGPIAGISFIC